jgi:hypothetical protein
MTDPDDPGSTGPGPQAHVAAALAPTVARNR